MKDKTLRDLKVGDEVFVVYQNDRYRSSRGLEVKTEVATVTKVGRKYAYLGEERRGQRFYRDTGVSAHSEDSNARENGHGFDVYLCDRDYRTKNHNDREAKRLNDRLLGRRYRIIELSPGSVAAIHAILDKEEAKP